MLTADRLGDWLAFCKGEAMLPSPDRRPHYRTYAGPVPADLPSPVRRYEFREVGEWLCGVEHRLLRFSLAGSEAGLRWRHVFHLSTS